MKKKLFAIIIVALLSISTATSCSDPNNPPPTPTLVPCADTLDWTVVPMRCRSFPPPDEIAFIGRLLNSKADNYPNNRLVLLFLQSTEIARGTTSTSGILSWYSSGVSDGIFVLHSPNTYQLSKEDFPIEFYIEPPLKFPDYNAWTSPLFLYTWIDNYEEGSVYPVYISSKKITYTIVSLAGDISKLPAEIQQPGSVSLLDGNRLVAVDPNAPEPAPQSAYSNSQAQFEQVTENVTEFPPAIFPLNNCGGGAEIKQEISQAYIHEIIDESKTKFGIELPLTDWLKIVFEVEKHYGISDKQITTYSTTLTVPAGQNVEYTVIRQQTWENGVAIVNDGIEVSAPYRILKSETFEVVNSQQKSCP